MLDNQARAREVTAYETRGLLAPVAPGLWEWLGRYDRVRGLVDSTQDSEGFVF